MTSFKGGVWGYGSYICDKCGQHMYVWSNIHQKSVTSFMDAPQAAILYDAKLFGGSLNYPEPPAGLDGPEPVRRDGAASDGTLPERFPGAGRR